MGGTHWSPSLGGSSFSEREPGLEKWAEQSWASPPCNEQRDYPARSLETGDILYSAQQALPLSLPPFLNHPLCCPPHRTQISCYLG